MAKQLGELTSGEKIVLNEWGVPKSYIVMQQGSPSDDYRGFEAMTLFLREKVMGVQRASGMDNDYENSSIDLWLHDSLDGFIASLDPEIRSAIPTVKIPYRPGHGNDYTVKSGDDGLSCKIFLLSMKEYNLTGQFPVEGVTLSYFVGSKDAKRIAYNESTGFAAAYSSRTPFCGYDGNFSDESDGVSYINSDGKADAWRAESDRGVRPAFCLPQSLYIMDDGTITTNQPPTAPASIDVANVGTSGTITITLTAATDPDGTVESYIYERQVDGGAWQQVAQVNSLTQTDTISEDWGTIAYRACAVDDLGASGPYVTGETQTINSGWVTIGGPAEAMGSKPVPFDFDFSVSVSGVASTGAITVYAALDGVQVYSGTPNAGTQISIPIDTRLMGAGEHTIEVQDSKDDYLPASKRYTFTIPAVTIPAGGTGEQAQGSDGRPVFHTTLAQRCIGRGGVDIQAQVDALTARVKTLEG